MLSYDRIRLIRLPRAAAQAMLLAIAIGLEAACFGQVVFAADAPSKDAPVPAPSLREESAGKTTSAETALGKAKHAKIPTTPLEIAEALGLPLLLTFLGTSVIAVWFTIERLVVLRRGRVIPRHFVERFLQNLEQGNLEPDQALTLCEENGSSIALIFAHGIRKWGKSSV